MIVGLPLISLTYSLIPLSNITPKAIAIPATSIAVNNPDLLGTWRATDKAVEEMYAKVYEGNPPDEVTGDIVMVFENTGELKLVYKDVTLNSDGLPPITTKGELIFDWQVPSANVFEMDPKSSDFKVETLGISIPAPDNIPYVKSPYGYEIDSDVLRLTSVPEGIYIPLEWEKR